MCGFLGVAGPNCARFFEQAEFARCLAKMAQRGPDDSGTLFWDNVWLGHRRLSIIDAPGGAQPMLGKAERSAIAYNGEVFNYQEVAQRLSFEMQTRSDTEVMLRAMDHVGLDSLALMRGMFAFAHYDQDSQSLVLARDPLGIKPLYWSRVGEHLVFGSELEPVRILARARSVRADALLGYLHYSYVPEPETVYEGVYALLPAHSLRFANGQLHIKEYWRPSLVPSARRDADTGIQKLIEEATSLTTVSDVPIASLLSGGIDSAVVASTLGASASYFNLAFAEGYDESEQARYTAQSLGVNVAVEAVEMRVSLDEASALLQKVGQPFGDTSIFACHRIFQAVSRTHKVCISADGADEVFAGYSMRRALLLERLAKLPASLTGSLGKEALAALLLRLLRTYFHRTHLDVAAMVHPEILRGWRDPYWQTIEREVSWALEQSLDVVNAVSWVLLRCNLPNDMLIKVDRSSMLSSLEVRVPFLDHKLVEAGLQLPGYRKQNTRDTKLPLKRMLASKGFKNSFLGARKRGFGPAPQTWADRLGAPHASGSHMDNLLTPNGRSTLAKSVYGRMAYLWESATQ